MTVVHVYLSVGPSHIRADSSGQVEVKMACNRWYSFEAKMRNLTGVDYQVVWAVFDCDRIGSVAFLSSDIGSAWARDEDESDFSSECLTPLKTDNGV